MAQHCGLATCFLDFTLQPYVALYFGAKSILQKYKDNSLKFSVYAIEVENSSFTQGNEKDDFFFSNKEKRISKPRYQLIQNNTYTNSYQVAQKGVFLALIRNWKRPNSRAEIISVEEYVKFSDDLIKFNIPRQESKKILRSLTKFNIDALHLFPGPYGIGEYIKERVLWDDKK
ncbi:FRG domain-containing protein [Leptospira noguchii]|nr:FRG domain-containing protein [Leptospira noguchii]